MKPQIIVPQANKSNKNHAKQIKMNRKQLSSAIKSVPYNICFVLLSIVGTINVNKFMGVGSVTYRVPPFFMGK